MLEGSPYNQGQQARADGLAAAVRLAGPHAPTDEHIEAVVALAKRFEQWIMHGQYAAEEVEVT